MIRWTGARAPLRAVTASSKLASIRVIQTTNQPHNIQFLSTTASTSTYTLEAASYKHIMSLDPPTYLSSLQNNIRARPIPWDGAVRAQTITEEQLTRIRAVDKVRKEQRKTTVEGDLEAYKKLFLGAPDKSVKSIFESAGKRADVVQYVLVLLGDLLEGMSRQLK